MKTKSYCPDALAGCDKTFNMRRKLIFSGGAFGLLGLSGCQTMETLKEQVLNNIDLGSGVMSGVGLSTKRYDGTNAEASEMAKAIFRQIDAREPITVVSSKPNDAQVALQAYVQAKQSFVAGKAAGGMNDFESVVMTLAPSIAGVVKSLLVAISDEQKKALGLQDKKANRQLEQKFVRNGSVVSIPSGRVLGYVQKGYCMDSSLPAPVRGDALQLAPVTNRVPQPLLPLYKAVGKWAEQPQNKGSAQNLTWAIMDAGTNSRWATNVDAKTLEHMNQALPGGSDTFQNYHNGQLMTKELLNKVLKKAKLDKYVNADQLMGQQPLSVLANRHLDDLIRQGQAMSEGKGTGYSMLAPNVAARAIGDATLSPKVEIVNLTGEDFQFDLLDWYAKPLAKKQSVSATTDVTGLVDRGVLVDEELSGPEKSMKMLADFASDVSKFSLDKTFGVFLEKTPAAARAISRVVSNAIKATGIPASAKKPLIDSAARLLGATPFIGNMLSGYEALSGKDWYSGGPLSDMERMFSMVGMVPGANALKAVAGAWKVAGASGNALNAAAKINLFKFADNKLFESAKTLNGWIWSDSAANTANMLAPGSRFDDALQWNQNSKKTASDFLILTRETLPWQKPVKDYFSTLATSGAIIPGLN